jgi:hypothetical protein
MEDRDAQQPSSAAYGLRYSHRPPTDMDMLNSAATRPPPGSQAIEGLLVHSDQARGRRVSGAGRRRSSVLNVTRPCLMGIDSSGTPTAVCDGPIVRERRSCHDGRTWLGCTPGVGHRPRVQRPATAAFNARRSTLDARRCRSSPERLVSGATAARGRPGSRGCGTRGTCGACGRPGTRGR